MEGVVTPKAQRFFSFLHTFPVPHSGTQLAISQIAEFSNVSIETLNLAKEEPVDTEKSSSIELNYNFRIKFLGPHRSCGLKKFNLPCLMVAPAVTVL